jgi:mono/diheme cytochrome c family protein
VPFVFGGCEWFSNFTRQPKVDPWEVATMDSSRLAKTPPRGNPQGSMPMFGGSPPEFVVSYGRFPLTIDSMSSLRNPTAPSAASLENGHKYYAINCAVCHGDAGDGNGLATNFQFPKISLLTESALGRSDGYLYGMIRNGRGLMPTYNRIEHMDRWDVVNYVRALQGRTAQTVARGPVGTPGETGTKVPGPTLTGPTRPVPHWQPAPAAGADTTGRVAGAAAPPGAGVAAPPGTASPSGATTPPGAAAPPPGGLR